jgi:hypothetical protein
MGFRALEIGVFALFFALVVGACSSSSEDPKGNAGESCTSRRDCTAGLACISQICVDPKNGSQASAGGIGESCQAHNDCGAGLSCVAHVCVTSDVHITPTAKSCFKVECAAQADCCKDFAPSPGCDQYKADCDANPAYCLTYHTFCECNRDCQDALCVDTPPACAADAECTSLLTPFCFNGHCAECAEHGDCPGEQDKCLDGECRPPCTQNEQCPLLSECQNGQCIEVGCKSDLECVFMLKDNRATCLDTKCQTPCTYDQECSDFQVCQEGKCVFIGCNDDEECRAYFGLENLTGDVKAACK